MANATKTSPSSFQPFPMPAVRHGSAETFMPLANTYARPAVLQPVNRHNVKKKRPPKIASQSSVHAWERWNAGMFKDGMPIDDTLINLTVDDDALPETGLASGLEQLQAHLLIDEEELVRLREEARQEGLNEGLKLGYLEGQKQGYNVGIALVENEVEKLRTLLTTLPQALRNNDQEIADDLLTLALDVGRQLVVQELSIEPELILPVVRELLQTEPALSGQPQLLLHPEDFSLVEKYLMEELQAVGWNIKSDPHLQRGDCRVKAESGGIDATLDTRWQRITAALGHHETQFHRRRDDVKE
ncbi:flagellar assembly protein FliH [Glaciimonas soli]|uniref:Flagellar assembly protein FliH n=1 Tax=Glaciimonas soli TaxID=2590999 RepID=A0A843YJ94_9BURK|nr:flagellar assembly protein FliH [Glaciimonas soli]MQQ99444.1 flagellar assembly protein FliH [Glaciimonas soli]